MVEVEDGECELVDGCVRHRCVGVRWCSDVLLVGCGSGCRFYQSLRFGSFAGF